MAFEPGDQEVPEHLDHAGERTRGDEDRVRLPDLAVGAAEHEAGRDRHDGDREDPPPRTTITLWRSAAPRRAPTSLAGAVMIEW